jgi:hypothetical protein
MDALGRIRDSLQRYKGASFAEVSVVGVGVDTDIPRSLDYLKGLGEAGHAFDEISIGNGWLNEQMLRFAWREGLAKPSVPQVLLMRRAIATDGYPKYLDMQSDTLVYRVSGRDSLVMWVAAGTPIPKSAQTQLQISALQ